MEPETKLDPWMIRVMVLDVIPVGLTSEISTIGGRVETSRKSILGIDFSYFMTQHWAIELQGGPFERDYWIKDSKGGDFKIGSVRNTALSLTLQYHLYPSAKLSPYIGLGINKAWTREVSPAPGIPNFDVKNITSTIFNAGIDYRLDSRWTLSGNFRYIKSPEYRFNGQNFESVVSMDTLVVGAGLGFRF
ncbi:OmpW/AlkL family protein [Pseudomonas marginalis]|nr:OmpW family outer membrane protein [Pseudomonas marginalis]